MSLQESTSVHPYARPRKSVSPLVAELTRLRKELGLSQVEVSRRIRRHPQMLCDWENGKCDPHFRNFENWVAALGYRIEFVRIE